MDDLTKKVVAMRESVPPMTFGEIGKILDISEDAAWRRYRKVKGKRPTAVEPGKESLSREHSDANNLVIEGTATAKNRIKTLEQLLKAAKVDLDVWEVERWVANKWEVAGKFGSKGRESFELQDLWQVKAWLIRKNPVAINPVIQPVKLKIKLPPKKKIKRSVPERAIVFGDMHVGFTRSLRTGILTPFHDRKALDVLLQIIEHVQPTKIVCLGDILDLADWSDKFVRSPNMYWTTQPSILELAWWFAQVRCAAPDAEIETIEGNHDSRMPRQIIEHMKEGYGLRSVDEMRLPPMNTLPRLLALHELEIDWIGDYPNGESWIGNAIACEHGNNTRAKSGRTAAALVDESQHTRIFGHIHRQELATKTLWSKDGSRTVSAFSPGCMCHVDGRVPGKKARQNWKQGIGVVDFVEQAHTIYPVSIDDGVAIFEGKVFEGRDRLDEIRESTKWEHL